MKNKNMNPNKIDVGNSDSFTIGGNKSIKNYKKWLETLNSNPEVSRSRTRSNYKIVK